MKRFVRSNFFPPFVEKIEKLKPSLSKQLKKMLKIRFEMLKIRINGKMIKFEKNSRENLPGIFESRESRELEIFRFSGG